MFQLQHSPISGPGFLPHLARDKRISSKCTQVTRARYVGRECKPYITEEGNTCLFRVCHNDRKIDIHPYDARNFLAYFSERRFSVLELSLYLWSYLAPWPAENPTRLLEGDAVTMRRANYIRLTQRDRLSQVGISSFMNAAMSSLTGSKRAQAYWQCRSK